MVELYTYGMELGVFRKRNVVIEWNYTLYYGAELGRFGEVGRWIRG